MEEKNKKVAGIVFGVLGAGIIISGVIALLTEGSADSNFGGKCRSFILVKEYSNYAWGISHSGSAVCDNGDIYTWRKYNQDYGEIGYSLSDAWIKKNGYVTSSIPNSDLNKLDNLIKDVQDEEFKSECLGADMGSTETKVWKNGKWILLRKHGDCDGESFSRTAQGILNIADKYLSIN